MRSCLLALLVGVLAAPARASSPDPWPEIRAAYLAGHDDRALTELRAILAVDPRDLMANYYLGLIGLKEGDRVTAAQAFREVAVLDAGGPFGADARAWLSDLPAPSPLPLMAPPVGLPSPIPEGPSPLPTHQVRLAPHRAPWLTALPLTNGHDPRSANPRPGYFKVADGSFEFKPPRGFVLLDEGVHNLEERVIFGPRGAEAAFAAAASPPTLLVTWRSFPELAGLAPAACARRERQLLFRQAAGYGPSGQLLTRFGVPCYRIPQREATWAAETWLVFKQRRLYAFTYGGQANQLARDRSAVEASLLTPLFYP